MCPCSGGLDCVSGLSSILYQRGIYPADDFKMVKVRTLPSCRVSQDQMTDGKCLSCRNTGSTCCCLTMRTSRLTCATSQTNSQVRALVLSCPVCSQIVLTHTHTAWLNNRQVSRLVLAIISKESRETLERWQFDVTLEDGFKHRDDGPQNNTAAASGTPPEASTSQSTAADKVNNNGHSSDHPSHPPSAAKKELSETDIRNQIQQMIKHICASNAFLPILEEKCQCGGQPADLLGFMARPTKTL